MAFSFSFTLVFAVVTLFGLGVLSIYMIDVVYQGYLIPILTSTINSSTIDVATQAFIIERYDRILFFLKSLIFTLFGITIIYMLVAAIRKEQVSQF